MDSTPRHEERRKSLMTVADVAIRLAVDRKTVYALINNSELEAVNIGFGDRSVYRVREEVLAEWLQKRAVHGQDGGEV